MCLVTTMNTLEECPFSHVHLVRQTARRITRGCVIYYLVSVILTTLRLPFHCLHRSDSGFVNVYTAADTMSSTLPEPDNHISNLVTTADMLVFHPQSELLCLASSRRTAAIRFVSLLLLSFFCERLSPFCRWTGFMWSTLIYRVFWYDPRGSREFVE